MKGYLIEMRTPATVRPVGVPTQPPIQKNRRNPGGNGNRTRYLRRQNKGKQSEHAESMTRSIHVKTKRDSRLLLVPSLLLMVSDSTPSVFQRCINHANILTSRTFRSTTASNLIASTRATGSVLDAYHYTQRHYGESDESTFGGGQLAASKTRAAK